MLFFNRLVAGAATSGWKEIHW